jgi:hypothetical protein
MFDTKIAIILRDDLLVWQKLNVTAFLMSGVAGANPEIIGEPYKDNQNNLYHRLSVQPVIVLAASASLLSTIHRRTLDRGVPCALFIEEMFATGHDTANRAVFAQFGPETARVVGLAFRADKKIADKIMKGASMHP